MAFESFVFVHIPKCGGTSFRNYLNNNSIISGVKQKSIYIPGCNGLNYNKNLNQLNEKELNDLQESEDLKILANHTKYQEETTQYELELPDPFYYTILRDPIKRFISHYQFFYFNNGYDNCKGIHLNDLPSKKLDAILEKLGNLQMHYISNVKLLKLIGLDNTLKIAKYNLQHEFRVFGILEQMEKSIKVLQDNSPQWLNFKSDFPLLNNSQPNEVLIKKKIINKIEEGNKYDLEFYKFGLNIFKDF